MHEKNKLPALLKACKKEELAQLKRFVGSAYFNRQPELSVLLDYLISLWPTFAMVHMGKENLFQVAYPDRAFDQKQYRYLTSALGRLIEQFWAVERWQQSTNQPQLLTMAVASERGVDKTYRKMNRSLTVALGNEQTLAESPLLLDRLHWSDNLEKHFGRSRERRYNDNLQRTSDYLDRYYFLEKLKVVCTMLDRKAIVAGDYEPHISAAWVSHLLAFNCFDKPILQLYYKVWQALHEEQDESHFWTLRDVLSRPVSEVPQSDLNTIYQILINYCARKIRQGKEPFIAEALNLYQTGLERKILLTDGELSPWAFTNIVKLAMRLHRYDWGEAFIRTNAPLLSEDFRANALHYNLAELYYYTHRHDEAMTHLNQVAYSDLNYYLGARVLLAKIYYEHHDEDPLLSLMASFMIFLKRNRQISADLKQTYLNFCDVLLALVKKHPKRLATLSDRIGDTKLLTDRPWLLEQCKALLLT